MVMKKGRINFEEDWGKCVKYVKKEEKRYNIGCQSVERK